MLKCGSQAGGTCTRAQVAVDQRRRRDAQAELLDPDLQALCEQLPRLPDAQQMQLLLQAMAPARHWTPAGLHATKLFWERVRS